MRGSSNGAQQNVRAAGGVLAGVLALALPCASITGAIILADAAWAPTWAQVRPQLPGSVEPGRPLERPPTPSTLPQADLEFRIPTPRRTAEPQASDELKFTVQDVIIEGNTLFDRAALQPLIAPVLGREVTVRDLIGVADAIEAMYRDAGYVLTRAVVPPQRVDNGTFRIRVVEGFIKSVVIEGASPSTRTRIEGVMQPVVGRPAQLAIMERALLLAGDLPSVVASGTLRPGDETGAAELVVTVQEKTLEGSANVNNRESRFSGRGSVFAEVAVNNTLGLNEQFAISGLASSDFQEQRFGGARWAQPIGSDGLVLTASGSYSVGEPGLSLRTLDTHTTSIIAGLRLSYPLLRERRRNVVVEGGFNWQRNDTDVLGARFSHDEYPSVDLRMTYSEAGHLWRGATAISAGVVRGIDALGASQAGSIDLSRADGRPDFTKFTGEVRRLQPIVEDWSASVTLVGQYSLDGLFASEEIGFGGSRIGRGYDPSEITGDHGIGAAFELRYGEAVQPWSYQPYAFYDLGSIWNRNAADSRISLASAGVGVRWAMPYGLGAGIEVARQLTHAPFTGDRDMETRLLFDLNARF